MKYIKAPFWILEMLMIFTFILPFSIGKIHHWKNILKSPLMLVMYYLSFTLATIFILLYAFTADMWLLTMAISLDQLGNTAMGGDEDNTLSGRLGSKIQSGESIHPERRLCYILSQLDSSSNTHCISSIED